MAKKQCWGPDKNQHIRGCRLGRPLCRWMRNKNPKRRRCDCPAYWFPHRFNSGYCGNQNRMWEEWQKYEEERVAPL
jgi:hypothetical protein